MLYIFESELPKNKSILYALTHIFGINKSRSNFICKKLGFLINLKVKDLTNSQTSNLLKT